MRSTRWSAELLYLKVMEELLTTEFFDPGIILGGIDPNDIIDYVISSYTINLSYILALYWHPKLQIYCDESNRQKMPIKTDIVHYITVPGGLYHAKFAIVTTKDLLRIVITTCNMTAMIHECQNDYYRLTIPRVRSEVTNSTSFNCKIFMAFLSHYCIRLTNSLDFYDWSGVSACFLLNVKTTTYSNIYDTYTKDLKIETVHVQCSAVTTKYFNVNKLLHASDVYFIYPENHAEFQKMNIYQFTNAVERQGVKKIIKSYKIPSHVKRYLINCGDRHFLIIGSANFTPQAWFGTNAELGIIMELKKI